jgi:serine/threonine-protein kinase HipA
MARRPRHLPLQVLQNGDLVGLLRHEASGATTFRYDASWLESERAFPISLSLPLREAAYSGVPVLAVFENLLPDSDVLRRLIATRVHAAGTDAYSLLTRVGRDCAGALQFLPEGEEPGPAGEVRGTPLDEEQIGTLLASLAAAPLGMSDQNAFRISIAGAQEKTALLRQDGEWLLPTGSTATTHILKPPIGRVGNGLDFSDSVENEYLCLRLIRALGLPAANVEIAEFAGRRALVVERFDRVWTGDGRLLRLPQEDCCQALGVPPGQKYESDGGPGMQAILELLQGSDTPLADQRTFLKAQMVFWLLAATDGHAKNFSFFLRSGGGYRLTPLYDVLSTQPQVAARQIPRNQHKLAMTAGDNRRSLIHQLQPRHFVQTARRAGIGAAIVRSIVEELAHSVKDAVETVIETLPAGFPMKLAESIRAGLLGRVDGLRLTDPE